MRVVAREGFHCIYICVMYITFYNPNKIIDINCMHVDCLAN